MTTSSRTIAPALALLAAGLGGCAETFTDVKLDNWEPEAAVPLLNTTFTLEDALRGAAFSESLSTDSSGAMRLELEESLFDVVPGDVLEFEQIVLPLADTAGRYDPADVDVPYGVTHVDLGAGNVIATFVNTEPVAITVDLTLASVWVDGENYSRTVTVPPFTSAADTLAMRTARVATVGSGVFDLSYRAEAADGRAVEPAAGVLTINTSGFTYAEGDFAELSVDLSRDSIVLELLDALEPGRIELTDPSITFTVENETGVEILVSAPEAHVVGRDGVEVELESELRSGSTVAPAAEGEAFATTRITLDGDNSNFRDAVNRFPEALVFALSGRADTTRGAVHTLRREDRVRGRLAFSAPLRARFREFVLEKAFDFDASKLAEAKGATFALGITNGFGLDVEAQIFFYDGAGALIDSLFAGPTLLAVSKGTSGDDTLRDDVATLRGPGVTQMEIPFTPLQIDELAATRSASIRLAVTSPRDGREETVLRTTDEMSVRLGVRVDVDPETRF